MAGKTLKRSKTVLISVRVPLKKINQMSTKTNKNPHYCNFLRISFFGVCVKEAVVGAFTFMFELNTFQIFAPRNDIRFCPLIVLQSDIFNAICDLALQLFTEDMKISIRQCGAIPVQYMQQRKCIVLICVQPEASLFS